MEIKNLSKYSDAEKIVLAEQLWDSVSKKDLEISDDVKNELDIRIKNLEEGKTELYTWDEVKSHLKIFDSVQNSFCKRSIIRY